MQRNSWCFTLNNPSEVIDWTHDDVDGLIRYAIYQEEIGESGTHHFQGYIECYRSVRLSALKKILEKAHWEVRRGTRDQARDYCRKQDETYVSGPYEYGDWSSGGSGARTDVYELKKKINEGKSQLELWESHPDLYLKYYRAITHVRTLITKPRSTKTDILFLYGDTGLGKTTYVQNRWPDAYWKQQSQWWDGYEGQSVVVLDEFCGYIPFNVLLRLGDSTPLLVESKGGQCQFVSTLVVIISNKLPDKWYPGMKSVAHFPALYRRLDNVNHFLEYQKFNSYSTYIDFENAVNTNQSTINCD